MATRIESGQMQLRSVGGVPMTQVQQQQVDYIGPRVAAQGASQLAQILDRMSASAFQTAAGMRQQEGLQFAAQNPLTSEQVQLAKDGVNPEGWFMGPDGKTAQIPNVNSVGFFGQAVAKARSLELSGHFEIEGRNELVKLLSQVEAGQITSDQVATKVQTMSDGYAKSLANIDPEASIKFRATMATHGNTVLNAAYKAELDKAKAQRIAKFDSDFDNSTRLLEQTISQGSFTDASGQQRSIDELADVFRKNVLTQSLLLGDKALQTEYSTKFEVALRTAKINSVTKALITDVNMVDPELTLKNLREGKLGNMSPVLQSMIVNDFDAVAKVTANFMVAVNNRKSIKDAKVADEKRAAVAEFVPLYEQAISAPEGSPARKKFAGQIADLATRSPDAVPIGVLKDLLEPSKEGNSVAELNVLNSIFLGTINSSDQIMKNNTLNAKQKITALKFFISEDRRDQYDLISGISKLSGIPVIPGSVVVVDPKGEEFKRRNDLNAESLQIQAEAARKGEVLTPRQILSKLEENLTLRRNSESAKAARSTLTQVYEKKEWINGAITRESLPALQQKAGSNRQKLQELEQIKKLIRKAEGEQ
jgi:hypothetical protein